MKFVQSTLQLLFALLSGVAGGFVLKLGRDLGAASAANGSSASFIVTEACGVVGILGGLAMLGWLVYGVAKDRQGWMPVGVSGLVAAIVIVGSYLLLPPDAAPTMYMLY